MQTSGFGILRQGIGQPSWLRSNPNAADYMHTLHASAPSLNPAAYRGTGREWLGWFFPPTQEELNEWFRFDPANAIELPARKRLSELSGFSTSKAPPDDAGANSELVSNLAAAQEVLALLPSGKYEILEMRRKDFAGGPRRLGFDIGYWGGDHFSLIADSFVSPKWHPPPPEVFPELASQLAVLNEHLLFPTLADAHRFRSWYIGQGSSWAEQEQFDGEFVIMELLSPPRD